MSDVSKTNETLIAEARGAFKATNASASLIARLADALEAATRVPAQGEPNNDREALRDEFRSYLGDEIYVSSRDYSAWAHGTMGMDDFSLAADDDEIIESLVSIALSRATVPDAATEAVQAELDEMAGRLSEFLCEVTGSMLSYSTYPAATMIQYTEEYYDRRAKEYHDDYCEKSEKLEEERDAATAAIERVRAIHANAGPSQGYDSRFKGGYGMLDDCCAACGSHGEYGVEWPCPTVAAIGGE